MSFKAEGFAAIFPGGLLIVLAGILMDVAHSVGLALGMIGFLLLIIWPIFMIVTHVRHGRLVKRSLPGPPPEDRAYDFVIAAKKIMIMFALPVALLGGLGIFCLVTAARGGDEPVLRIGGGVGSLLLLVSYLLFFLLGRTSLTLRLIGVALVILGGVVTVGVLMVILDDGASVGNVVGLLAGLVMLLGGLWLAVTGRNAFQRPETRDAGAGWTGGGYSVRTKVTTTVSAKVTRKTWHDGNGGGQ